MTSRESDAVPWPVAWERALYGPTGFYRRPEGPAGHFRTASHAGPELLACALLELARRTGCRAIVDVGAGRGELLTALAAIAPGGPAVAGGPHTPAGAPAAAGSLTPAGAVVLHGADLVPRPAGLPPSVGWSADPAALDVALDRLSHLRVLVVALELLDVVPCPVLQADGRGRLRQVLVRPDGEEELGGPATAEQQRWAGEWWPAPEIPADDVDPEAGLAHRVEVGLPREALWARLVARVPEGCLVAIDYAHRRGQRPPGGSLAGYRSGRLVSPVPDCSCDLTAHVALDAVAEAGRRSGARSSWLGTQRAALAGLLPELPRPEANDVAGLVRASQLAELRDPRGLGGFSWLIQTRGAAGDRFHDAGFPAAPEPDDRR